MKAAYAIGGAVVGAVLTGAAASGIASLKENHRQTQLGSNVIHPLRRALEDVVKTYDRGDAALAERKVRLLHRHVSDWWPGGGPAPEAFAHEIVDLDQPASGPASLPAR
jgi:hypothetical protein